MNIKIKVLEYKSDAFNNVIGVRCLISSNDIDRVNAMYDKILVLTDRSESHIPREYKIISIVETPNAPAYVKGFRDYYITVLVGTAEIQDIKKGEK